ncbi:MAG: hypothetical protein LAT64_04465 [Phycisphaerales bacterium]|nr:hypothetical protein [Planctomycetota bacterium]MCH8508007.1 hypothetical protein [Phycisphaerales bacterium]
MRNTRAAIAAAGLGLVLPIMGGCSVSPNYQVRVVNDSPVTVVASIVNNRSITQPETLAQARIRPNDEAVLGPVKAPPLDPVELRISQPSDMGTLPSRHRLTRGNWAALIAGSGADAWQPFSVQVERD